MSIQKEVRELKDLDKNDLVQSNKKINSSAHNFSEADEKLNLNHQLLFEAGYALASIELSKFSQIGKVSTNIEFKELHTYFGSTPTRWAFASLLFKYFYNKELLKKILVSKILKITPKAAYEITDESEKHKLIEFKNTKEFIASPLFIKAYLSYIKKEVELARKPFMKLASIFNTIEIFDKKK